MPAAPITAAGGDNPFVGARPLLAPPLPRQCWVDRRSDAAALQRLLRTHRAVILCGGAGVGKSSLLHAELVPALAATGATVLQPPPGWPDDQLAAWCAQAQSTLPPAPCILVGDPADRLTGDALAHCLDLLPAAPQLGQQAELSDSPQ